MDQVYLIGFMGAGKSTVGRLVAQQLQRPFVDLDEVIVASAGMPVREIFDTHGEERFRELESEALEAVASGESSVVACGGGVVLSARNRTTLSASGTVIYLQVSVSETLARVGDDPGRPLLRLGPVSAEQLYAARQAIYASVADIAVDTVGKTPVAVADEALEKLESAR